MSSKPFIARFMDGRDASDGTPWEKGGPNEPVFVDSFIDWEGVPFILADDGRLFRMRSSKDTSSGYLLDPNFSIEYSTVLMNGDRVSESEAVTLL
ncbi:MAG: hypothetical protein LBN96_05105 [Desulfovibrio sp.]|nr:hypothetical protein [Desulfovibrio sp.]